MFASGYLHKLSTAASQACWSQTQGDKPDKSHNSRVNMGSFKVPPWHPEAKLVFFKEAIIHIFIIINHMTVSKQWPCCDKPMANNQKYLIFIDKWDI